MCTPLPGPLDQPIPFHKSKRTSRNSTYFTTLAINDTPISTENSRRLSVFRNQRTRAVALLSISVDFLSSKSKLIFKFPNRNRAISTSRLNHLRDLHLTPINLVISQGS